MSREDDPYRPIRAGANRALARREYGVEELRRKLCRQGLDRDRVDEVLTDLCRQGLLSDERFAAMKIRSRVNQGYGKLRILHELQEDGVPESVIDKAFVEEDTNWFRLMDEVRQKRFGKELPADFGEVARQSRFLQYRGFEGQLIRKLFRHGCVDDF